jgi:hypothetical protein
MCICTRGTIYGGIIAARIIASLGFFVDLNDILLTPQRLDFAAMKVHHFVNANSCAGSLVYRMLFTDGDEREFPLLQPSLFSICRRPWSRSKEELNKQLGLLGFHRHHGSESQEGAVPSDYYAMHYTEASSSSYQDEGTYLSHFGGATSWPSWD